MKWSCSVQRCSKDIWRIAALSQLSKELYADSYGRGGVEAVTVTGHAFSEAHLVASLCSETALLRCVDVEVAGRLMVKFRDSDVQFLGMISARRTSCGWIASQVPTSPARMPQTSISTWLTRSISAAKKEEDNVSDGPNPGQLQKPLPPPPVPEKDSIDKAAKNLNGAIRLSDSKILSTLFNLRKLPPNVTLEPITSATLKAFRRMNSLLLPIPYPDKFYNETISDPVVASISLSAIWREEKPERTTNGATASPVSVPTLAGAIRCRLLQPPADADKPRNAPDAPILYISTIGTLAPYRRHNLATHLLDAVTKTAVDLYGAEAVTAHVWEANTEALEWYEKRGFTVIGKEDAYYRRLKPSGAFSIRKELPNDGT